MDKFEAYFENKSKILQEEYNLVSEIDHRGTKGSAREVFIKEFLEEIYPERYVVGDGEIVDAEGNVSNQADVVVYDDHLPLLEYGSTKHFLSEGVMAHIEIKSDLSSQLENALEKTDSVKKLERDVNASMSIGHIPPSPFSSIFAFNGPTKETFKKNIGDYYETKSAIAQGADLICVLDKYIMVKLPIGNGTVEPTEHYEEFDDSEIPIVPCVDEDGQQRLVTFFETNEDSLMWYTVFLAQAVHRNWMGTPDVRQYLSEEEYSIF